LAEEAAGPAEISTEHVGPEPPPGEGA
jgi:hypothetical protein